MDVPSLILYAAIYARRPQFAVLVSAPEGRWVHLLRQLQYDVFGQGVANADLLVDAPGSTAANSSAARRPEVLVLDAEWATLDMAKLWAPRLVVDGLLVIDCMIGSSGALEKKAHSLCSTIAEWLGHEAHGVEFLHLAGEGILLATALDSAWQL